MTATKQNINVKNLPINAKHIQEARAQAQLQQRRAIEVLEEVIGNRNQDET